MLSVLSVLPETVRRQRDELHGTVTGAVRRAVRGNSLPERGTDNADSTDSGLQTHRTGQDLSATDAPT
jgi:hypothetical protein